MSCNEIILVRSSKILNHKFIYLQSNRKIIINFRTKLFPISTALLLLEHINIIYWSIYNILTSEILSHLSLHKIWSGQVVLLGLPTLLGRAVNAGLVLGLEWQCTQCMQTTQLPNLAARTDLNLRAGPNFMFKVDTRWSSERRGRADPSIRWSLKFWNRGWRKYG